MALVGGVGRINIDMLYAGIDHLPAPGEEVFSDRFGIYLGGGTPAALVTLRRLGVETRILSFLGDDFFSDFARREFCSAGADVINLYQGSGIPVVLSSTMVCGGDRAFMSHTDPVDVTDALLVRIYEQLRDCDVALMQPGYLSLYRALKADGVKLVFDTGWEEDLSISKYADYLALADYYLPNRKEALKITGTDSVEAAVDVLSRRLPCPIVKLDSEGCLYMENGEIHVVPPMPGIKAVDATGAGDAFMAGFIYGLVHGCDIRHCIRFGNITGATCVQDYGCLTRYVTEAQLLQLCDEVYGA